MVKIRLRREGKKKQPVYLIVVADSRSSRAGKFNDRIGQYRPLDHPSGLEVNEEKLFRWLRHGAVPTDTTRSLLQRNGLWLKWSLVKKGADGAVIATEMEKWQQMQPAKAERQTARKARRKATKKKKHAEAVQTPAPAPAAAEAPAAAPSA